MEYRFLGSTGVRVSPICLGTMMFGGRTTESDSIEIINRAIDDGINFIDTAKANRIISTHFFPKHLLEEKNHTYYNSCNFVPIV